MKNILSNEKELKGRKMKPSLIKKGLIAAALGLTLSSGVATAIPVEPAKVEAANKDRKKPKITFKGKTKLTAEEGEKVTIPKTNFSDNVTKKKKLKLGVTVKKGKKSYKTIANSIKKATLNNKTTSVAFPEEGTYKITYTVTDLAKNVATKARTVTVTDKEIIEEDTMTPKEDPTTEEQRRVVTTETTTEQPKTEQPKVETPTVDLSKYADYKTITINGNSYNIVSNFKSEPVSVPNNIINQFKFDFKNVNIGPKDGNTAREKMYLGIGDSSEFKNVDNIEFYFIGETTLKFETTDLSKNILFKREGAYLEVYFVHTDGNLYRLGSYVYLVNGKYEEIDTNTDFTFPCPYSEDDKYTYQYNDESEVVLSPVLKENVEINNKKIVLKNKIVQR